MLISVQVADYVLDPNGLLPSLDWEVRRQFLRLAWTFHKRTGNKLCVRSAKRSCREQAAIFAKGRTAPGAIESGARGCRSWHVTGRAVDANVILPSGKRSWVQADYEVAGRIWEDEFGGIWGGDFPGFGPGGDAGHFEFHPEHVINDVCPEPDNCELAEQIWYRPNKPLWAYWPQAFYGLLAAGVVTSGAVTWRKLR